MRKIKKVLYLADRNILIEKPYNEEFAPFGNSRTLIKKGKIDTAYEIYFGLYQQLDNGHGASNLETFKQVSKNFFDLIIVDECHRGSAKEDSHWREILEYFDTAIQVGMTATPKVYTKNKILFICEHCLKYMKHKNTLIRHIVRLFFIFVEKLPL